MSFGRWMWDLDYSQTDSPIPTGDSDPLKQNPKAVHYTILFNTYIFLTLFNEINCRKVGSRQFNVFTNLLSNLYFLGVILFILGFQFTLVEMLPVAVRLESLSGKQMAGCIVLGSTVLVAAAILKLTPDNWIKKLPITIDENKKIDENDPLMKIYNK